MVLTPSALCAREAIDARTAIRNSTVILLVKGGVAAVTVPAICAAADVTEAQFRVHHSSVAAAFGDIVLAVMAQHRLAIRATLSRRRSLTESLRQANYAFLDVVEAHVDAHCALLHLMVGEPGKPGLVEVRRSARTVHEELMANCGRWLIEIGRIHDSTWELPSDELTALVVATMTGATMDYLCGGSLQETRLLLDLAAFDLARRSRRRTKTMSY